VRLRLRWLILSVILLVSACNADSGSTAEVPTTLVEAATTTSTPEDATEIFDSMPGPLEPGEYWMDHDWDPATNLRVDFTVDDPGWEPIIGRQGGE
jgi:hypothetical protein